MIVVDEDVDPFNLPQVMWAVSTKMNPADDLIRIPNLSVMALAPQVETIGLIDKVILDATTSARYGRGGGDQQVRDLPEAAEWVTRLQDLMKAAAER